MLESYPTPASSFTSPPNKYLSPILLHCLPAAEEGELRPRGAFQHVSVVNVHQMSPGGTASQMQCATQMAIQVLTSRTSTSHVHQGLGVTGEQNQNLFPGLYTQQLAPLSTQDIKELKGVLVSLRLARANCC